jgi:hypothetical protein
MEIRKMLNGKYVVKTSKSSVLIFNQNNEEREMEAREGEK